MATNNTVKFDAKTGKKLATGASTTDSLGNVYKQGTTFAPKITSSGNVPGTNVPLRNDNQANGGAGYNKLSNTSGINPDSALASTQFNPSANIPSIAKTNVVAGTALTGNNPSLTIPQKTETIIPTITPAPLTLDQQLEAAQKKSKDDFQTYLDKLIAPPSSADAYKKAQKETGILGKQQTVNDLTGKLNGIVATGEAQKLSLVGQGRGIPEAIIGGQQAEIGRETAIQALPVQAQLSAAQGDLQTATENLNTLFKIYSDDATNKYNYKKSVNEAVYAFADKQDQVAITEIQKKQDREYDEKQKALETNKALTIEAAKNGASAATLLAISKAPDFSSAIKAAGTTLRQVSYQQLQNGDTVVLDGQGRVIRSLGGATPTGIIAPVTVNGTPVEKYTLSKGGAIDDPYFIAQRNGITVEQLKALNPKITNWNAIQIGTTINVPSKSAGKQEAINTILGSAKFTKDQKADLINSINNGQDPLSVIKNQAKNIMGQTEATTVTKYETAKSALKDIDTNLKKFYAAGGSTGIFSGNYEKVINKLGSVDNPQLVELATEIQANLQVYRNAVSGTAYSEQEGKDINSIFPGINKTAGLNNAIINGRIRAFDSTIDGTYRATIGNTTYDALKTTANNNTPKTPVDPVIAIKTYGDTHPLDKILIANMQKSGYTIEAIITWINQRQ